MAMTDPLADMLTRIRNATMVKKDVAEIPASKLKTEIAKVLKSEGYIKGYKIEKDNKQGILKIALKYDDQKNSVVEGIKRVSKPGSRVYVKGSDVAKVINGYGIAILSTSKGLMVDREARKANIGGEILCNVW
ncbi:MAG: 30S ribosomal protein S8 [Deltaproteobacteria bacterium]|nr:30S ribosomal protein S8 [Deltaproteobacteria bacterium]